MRNKNGSTSDLIYSVYEDFTRLTCRLPFQRITRDEVRRLGGRLIGRALEAVWDVGEQLATNPGLYPDAGVSGPELIEDQRTADAWLFLAGYFDAMRGLCVNNYVLTQAVAFDKSKRMIAAVISGWEHPAMSPHLDHHRRVDGMMPAIRAITEDHARKGQQPARAPAAPPDGTSGPAAAQRTPRQEQAIRQQIAGRKQDRKTQIMTALLRFLSSRLRPA